MIVDMCSLAFGLTAVCLTQLYPSSSSR
jgi:hypothetical protein